MRGINELKRDCERTLGRSAVSPADFNELSLKIERSTGRNLSVSSLKRLWGYVEYPHQPSNETLSILAAYAGYRDWFDFKNADPKADSSDFLSADIVKAADLTPGASLRLRWKPDRVCLVQYAGGGVFKVLESENSKLIPGDTFCCNVMAKGEPLICHDVTRQGERIAEVYIAGKTGGLLSF